MGELRAQSAGLLNMTRPRNNQRIARAAQVRSHLLAPLKRRASGKGPSGRVVVQIQVATHLAGQREALLHTARFALRGERVMAFYAAFGAGAVVAGNIEDDGVLVVAFGLDIP